MSQVLRSMASMLPAAASSVKLPNHKLIDHRLDVVQSAHQLFQRLSLLFAPDTALERYPSALAFGPDAGVGEATVGEDSLLDAWNDLLVVEIRARKPAAPGQEATRTAFNAHVPLGSHLGLRDHWTLRHGTVSDPFRNLKKGIVEVIRALFGQGRSNERCRHGSEQYRFQGSCAMHAAPYRLNSAPYQHRKLAACIAVLAQRINRSSRDDAFDTARQFRVQSYESVRLQLSECNVLGVVGRGPPQLIRQFPSPTPEYGIAKEPDRRPSDPCQAVARDVGRDLSALNGLVQSRQRLGA